MANFTKLTAKKKERFLTVLRKTANISKACRAIKLSRVALYKHKAEQPEFAQQWKDALNEALDSLEGEVYRRATKGVKNDIFYQGIKCGEKTEYSDTLAIFLLKSHRPEVYAEKIKQEITGANGSTLSIEVKPIDYRTLLTSLTQGSSEDSDSSS